jgi:hypothetical protein
VGRRDQRSDIAQSERSQPQRCGDGEGSDKARRFSLERTPKIVRLLALAIHAAIRPVRARHPSACDDRPGVFRFLLKLEDSDPHDPAVLVTPVPNRTVGETFSTGRGDEWAHHRDRH